MMDFTKIAIGFLFLLLAFCYQIYQKLSRNLPRPDYDLKEYWGKGDAKDYVESTDINMFRLAFTDEYIDPLKKRLDDFDEFTEPLEDTAFEYGFNTNRLKEVIDYWRNSYLGNWTEKQNYLNKYLHYTTQIQGLTMDFLHEKPEVKDGTKVYKLLLLHGWPGSVREFYEIIPLLTKPSKENIAFEVIAPSLPGFLWSDGAKKKGLGPDKIAVVISNLMERVGADKFYIQGGDWGGIIGAHLAALFSEKVLGYHTNYIVHISPLSVIKTTIASFFPSFFIEDPSKISWMYPFSKEFKFLMQETGYFHLQATKPDTLGIALNANPIGLAAWILEKFSTATNRDYRKRADGGFEDDFTLDALLDNIMLYYFSKSITTSVRIYKENFNKSYPMERVAIEAPTGVAYFKNEIQHQFKFLTQERFKNIIHESYFEHGGHFAALQQPEVLYKDFYAFVQKTLKLE